MPTEHEQTREGLQILLLHTKSILDDISTRICDPFSDQSNIRRFTKAITQLENLRSRLSLLEQLSSK